MSSAVSRSRLCVAICASVGILLCNSVSQAGIITIVPQVGYNDQEFFMERNQTRAGEIRWDLANSGTETVSVTSFAASLPAFLNGDPAKTVSEAKLPPTVPSAFTIPPRTTRTFTELFTAAVGTNANSRLGYGHWSLSVSAMVKLVSGSAPRELVEGTAFVHVGSGRIQGIPEPSSLVLVTTLVLSIVLFQLTRRFMRSKKCSTEEPSALW